MHVAPHHIVSQDDIVGAYKESAEAYQEAM